MAERYQRGFFDRAQDEVRSWMGDGDAARRRRRDLDAGFGPQGRDEGPGPPLGTVYGYDPQGRQGSSPLPGRVDAREIRGGEGAGRRGRARGERPHDPEPNYGFRPAAGFDERQDAHDDPHWGARTPSGYGVGWRGGEPRGYSGRGPRGYRRSDTSVLEDVCDRLTAARDVDAGDIEVHVQDGEVTLAGTVRDREQKRRAEDVAEDVRGVHDVHNRLRVVREEP